MTGFKKFLAAGFTLAAGLGLSNTASAATIYGELLADTGVYAPVALGDTVALDGCGSVFDFNPATGVSGPTVSLCNGVTDLSPFDFTWSVFDAGFSLLGYLENVTTNMTTGGVGDLITSAGTYFLSLNVTLSPSSSTFALPGGNTGAFQPTPFNTDPNADTHFSGIALIVNPAAVPEPAGALLLLPAVVFMARRQRKLRKKALAA
ncbi:hypothetical protein [Kordiimonas sp.]|uniref:hypothetical protein n=1 Tax=Kordiimonas sp. TaxID=1970157 RepID=UPI003A91F0EB